jgi:hypothetical protein
MFSFKKAAVAAALVVASASSVALAEAQPRYVLKRIPGGPRPDQYVFVRAVLAERTERPYALTGTETNTRRHQAVWPKPLHPKGPRGEY